MTSKKDYLQARETVENYENELLNKRSKDCPCWILIKDELVFVTEDKDFADRCYDTGEYTVRESCITNP